MESIFTDWGSITALSAMVRNLDAEEIFRATPIRHEFAGVYSTHARVRCDWNHNLSPLVGPSGPGAALSPCSAGDGGCRGAVQASHLASCRLACCRAATPFRRCIMGNPVTKFVVVISFGKKGK